MIVVLDFSLMYYRMMFGSKRKVIENTDFFAHLLMNGVIQNMRDFDLDKENRLIVALDCKKSDNWRREYYLENSKDFPEYMKPVRQTYKGNRVKDDEMPWDKIYEILEDFINTMVNYSDVQVIQHKRAEADDIISVIAKKYGDIKEVGIVSNDKDFHQLLTDKVKLFDPIRRKRVTVENSKQLLLEHILTGQKKKDNIFPVKKGVGPATARKMINNLKATFKLEPEIKKRFDFNRKLIDLDLVPEDIQKEIDEMLDKVQFNYSLSNLVDFCRRYNLKQHIDNMPMLKMTDGNSRSLW